MSCLVKLAHLRSSSVLMRLFVRVLFLLTFTSYARKLAWKTRQRHGSSLARPYSAEGALHASNVLAKLLRAFTPRAGWQGNAVAQLAVTSQPCSQMQRWQTRSFMQVKGETLGLNFNLRPDELTVGRTVVPTLAQGWESSEFFRTKRDKMFDAGLYPGVDYLIEEVGSNSTVVVRPIYPLKKILERSWPVTVSISLAPRWVSPAAYNVMAASFSIVLGASTLAFFFALSFCVTLSFIPSASMSPSVEPGDVLLVEKVSPRFKAPLAKQDLVFFEPPPALREIGARRNINNAPAGTQQEQSQRARELLQRLQGLQQSPLFIKRIAAVPGDEVAVSRTGSVTINGLDVYAGQDLAVPDDDLAALLRSDRFVVPPNSYVVLGDNAAVSIDSRCWGPLPANNIVGRPLLRVWPSSRLGPVK